MAEAKYLRNFNKKLILKKKLNKKPKNLYNHLLSKKQ
jgi:hypothetical protein